MNEVLQINVPVLARYDAACKAIADAKTVDEVLKIKDEADRLRQYARQSKNRQLEIDASEIRFRAERHVGVIMAKQKATVGLAKAPGGSKARPRKDRGRVSPDPSITLAEAGIDKDMAKRARKLAAIPDKEFENRLKTRREDIEAENKRVTMELVVTPTRGTAGTGENEWYTPKRYIDLAREVMGSIDLDPASSHAANQVVMAEQFFSAETDGLKQEWQGNVWLNPPYAQPLIAEFVAKMLAEGSRGYVTQAIVLTHNYTDTAWFQDLAEYAAAICFTRGRVKFESPTGEIAAPTQGQAFFYFGDDAGVGRFSASFADVGFVVEVLRRG